MVFFFFKQKTAYEMRIICWSSDVCSSDLAEDLHAVERRVLQPDIEHHEARPALAQQFQRAVAVAGIAGLIALILQDTGDQHADVGFVVDDEDFVSPALQLFPQPASDRKSTRLNSSH